MAHLGIYNRQASGYKRGKGVKVNRWQTQIEPRGFPKHGGKWGYIGEYIQFKIDSMAVLMEHRS